jgi:hypothetical protein
VHLPDSGKHSGSAERPVFHQENTRARARARSLVSSKEKEKERKGRVGLAQNPARFFFWPEEEVMSTLSSSCNTKNVPSIFAQNEILSTDDHRKHPEASEIETWAHGTTLSSLSQY